MGAFQNLGKSLRWLRTRQDRKQYEIAEEAGITKAMLSAYETGKQNPSIETLEKLLGALQVDLLDLHNALRVNQSDDEGGADSSGFHTIQRQRARQFPVAELRSNIYHILDVEHPLPADQEVAFSQMLAGFHSLLRHMYSELTRRSSMADNGEPGSNGS